MKHPMLRTAGLLGVAAAAVCCTATAQSAAPGSRTAAGVSSNPTPIKHVIIIMQENRSFDSYFGTYPGANGIPRGTCVPIDPTQPGSGCVRPFHDPRDANAGGPHGEDSAQFDLDDGITTTKMDGFIYTQAHSPLSICQNVSSRLQCANFLDGVARHDVLGYHTAEEIPNYWSYAEHFVLQDEMFEGVRAWSVPSHLDLTSEWVANCPDPNNVATCRTSNKVGPIVQWPWANLFQLLDKYSVSWKYYLGSGTEPDCEDDEMTCAPQVQVSQVGSFFNPVPYFKSVRAQGAPYLAAHNQPIDQFLVDAESNTLPQVAWVVPSNEYSEHPPNGVTAGMEYVTSLVNAVMSSPAWNNSAIFISWDDWGGFYDHVAPPNVDVNSDVYPIQGFGLRVPGLLISPFAKRGLIDHNVLSTNSYATFFEDLFMGGARLEPAALGAPDSRPDIRDKLRNVTFVGGRIRRIGSLMDEFDFTQTPLRRLLLPTHIPTGITAICSADDRVHCTTGTVSLSWNAVAAGGVPGPFTYHIRRDSTELAQCVTSGTVCTDTPGTGVHLYRIYSVSSGGVASPLSAAVEADVP